MLTSEAYFSLGKSLARGPSTSYSFFLFWCNRDGRIRRRKMILSEEPHTNSSIEGSNPFHLHLHLKQIHQLLSRPVLSRLCSNSYSLWIMGADSTTADPRPCHSCSRSGSKKAPSIRSIAPFIGTESATQSIITPSFHCPVYTPGGTIGSETEVPGSQWHRGDVAGATLQPRLATLFEN